MTDQGRGDSITADEKPAGRFGGLAVYLERRSATMLLLGLRVGPGNQPQAEDDHRLGQQHP